MVKTMNSQGKAVLLVCGTVLLSVVAGVAGVASVVAVREAREQKAADACSAAGGIIIQPARPGEPLFCQLQSAGDPRK